MPVSEHDHTDRWMVCKARRSDGSPCRAPAIKGGRVCQAHGGATKHIRDAANRRLEELVMPSISKLRTLMLRGETHSVQLKAATEILDRAGIIAEQKVELDNQVSITVSYADVELAKRVVAGDTIEVGYAELPSGNGHEKAAPKGGDDRNG